MPNARFVSAWCTTSLQADELQARVEAIEIELATAGPAAIAAAKRLIADVGEATPAQARTLTARAIAARRTSSEGQEGLRAFLERRAPNWVAK